MLRITQHDGTVALCLHYTPPKSYGVDLFLAADDGVIHNLHASAMLGERTVTDDAAPTWTWWNHHDWSASVARVTDFRTLTFAPAEATEFHIRRQRFPGRHWRLRLDVHTREPGIVFPAGTAATHTGGWLELKL
ncbi:hypothetical protein [Tahibacter amnicola]|uniref:Uncharacterized protein n=1 Tax=Tahibacter amnicola TaxID=2976241 RepID=A0ABY6BG27_9GAMM|nr:hypothetical protein [Tahibacter amnicola]UXI68790.1 hypothetical protein N4264_03810 [Tahibacter amnicola]